MNDHEPRVIITLKEYNRLTERDEMLDQSVHDEHRARIAANTIVSALVARDPSLEELQREALDWAVKAVQELVPLSENVSILVLRDIGKELFFGRFERIFRENGTGVKDSGIK